MGSSTILTDMQNNNKLTINNIEKLVGTELHYTLRPDENYSAYVSEVHTGLYYYRIELNNFHTVFIDRQVYGSDVLILVEMPSVPRTVRFEQTMDIGELHSIPSFCERMGRGKWTQTR